MRGKQKPAAQGSKRAFGNVVAGQRDTRKATPKAANGQAGTEREKCDGRVYLGTVREISGGAFVAIVDEQVLGAYDTIAAVTDAVLDVAREGGGQ